MKGEENKISGQLQVNPRPPNLIYTDIQDFLQILNMPRCNHTFVTKRLYYLMYKWTAHVVQTWFHPVGTGEPFIFRVILTNNRNLTARLNVLRCLVQEFGFDINQRRRHDLSTILHIATWRNRTDITPTLLKLGADPRAVNVYLETPGQSVKQRAETDVLLFVYTSSGTSTNPNTEAAEQDGGSKLLKELAVKLTDTRAGRVLYQEYFSFEDSMDSPAVYELNTSSAQSAILAQVRNKGWRIRTAGFQLHRHLPMIARFMPALFREIGSETLDVATLIFFLNNYMCSRYFRQKNKPQSVVNLVTQGVNQATKVTQRIFEDFGKAPTG